jgi:hypothetical protein
LIPDEVNRLEVFEKRVLRGMIGPKRDEMLRGQRKLLKEEFQNLCSPPNIVRMIKSRRMKCAGHVARMGQTLCGHGSMIIMKLYSIQLN